MNAGGDCAIFRPMKLLSVVMPVYNELATIEQIVSRVLAQDLPLELVAVDDCSSDGTGDKLRQLAERHSALRLFRHEVNQGKGAAVATGLKNARGEVIVIQDADLEYDPADYPRLLQPILTGEADVVFGSRFLGDGRKNLQPVQALANRFLTWYSNLLSGLRLTDMETCYKMFRAELVRGVEFHSRRFGIEPELTAHFARRKARVLEVPIAYTGRSRRAGKKIGFKDGLEAIWAVTRFNLLASAKNNQSEPGK